MFDYFDIFFELEPLDIINAGIVVVECFDEHSFEARPIEW